MQDPDDSGHRYSDDEVRAILARAVETRSRTSSDQEEPGTGLTLREIQEVAAEAGIDPVRIRDAALATRQGPPGGGSVLLGPSKDYVVDRTVSGEFGQEQWADLVGALRRITRSKGKVSEVGDWLEWRSELETLHVTVKPRGGKTTLQFMADAGGYALAAWGLPMFLTLIALVVTGKDLGMDGVGLMAMMAGSGLAVARMLWEFAGRFARRKHEAYAEEITREIERLAMPVLEEDSPEED